MQATDCRRPALLQPLRRYLRRQALPGPSPKPAQRRGLRSMRLTRPQYASSAHVSVAAARVVSPRSAPRGLVGFAAVTGRGGHVPTACHQWPDPGTARDPVAAAGNPLVVLHPPSQIHSQRSPFLMVKQTKRRALIPRPIPVDTRVLARTPKAARLRGFSAPPPGHRWPGAWPGQPGPIVREAGPFVRPPSPASALGQPLGLEQASALIGCSPWTVRQTLIPRGLPHFRFRASGRLIFYRDQVIRWIENQQQGGKTT